jgi:hypothetical protein
LRTSITPKKKSSTNFLNFDFGVLHSQYETLHLQNTEPPVCGHALQKVLPHLRAAGQSRNLHLLSKMSTESPEARQDRFAALALLADKKVIQYRCEECDEIFTVIVTPAKPASTRRDEEPEPAEPQWHEPTRCICGQKVTL